AQWRCPAGEGGVPRPPDAGRPPPRAHGPASRASRGRRGGASPALASVVSVRVWRRRRQRRRLRFLPCKYCYLYIL
ncbi:hypothetical protein E2320_013928, partial [Naja naja]